VCIKREAGLVASQIERHYMTSLEALDKFIKMTERYAKLARKHLAKTGSTARKMWKLMEQENCGKANVG
jgi:hypothetical protein